MSHDDDPFSSGLPTWITRYGDTLRDFGRDPSGFVIGIVATWIVGGILMMGRTVVDAILLAFDVVVNALELVSATLVGALDAVGLPILDAATGVPAFFAELVEPFGPLAPFVGAVALTVIFVLLYRAGKAILLEIPVLGAVLEFLGADL